MTEKTLGQRLRHLRSEKGYSRKGLAEALDLPYTTYANYENDYRYPPMDILQKLSNIVGVSIDYLLVGEEITQNKIRNMTSVPILGSVQAGVPVEAIQDIVGQLEIPIAMAQKGDHFALQVRGDSMEPRFISGDVVIVKKQEDVENGETGIILVNGNDATMKKVVKHENGISLVAFNPAYTPMFYTNGEIESLPIRILGKVVELRARF